MFFSADPQTPPPAQYHPQPPPQYYAQPPQYHPNQQQQYPGQAFPGVGYAGPPPPSQNPNQPQQQYGNNAYSAQKNSNIDRRQTARQLGNCVFTLWRGCLQGCTEVERATENWFTHQVEERPSQPVNRR